MKSRIPDQPALQRQPSAATSARVSHSGGSQDASNPVATLQRFVDRSPRLRTQAQALQASLAAASRHETDAPAQATAAPVQRVGHKGHMAIGAAIGSIVPILGTALGAYIGHRIYRSKKNRARRRQGGATIPQIDPRTVDVPHRDPVEEPVPTSIGEPVRRRDEDRPVRSIASSSSSSSGGQGRYVRRSGREPTMDPPDGQDLTPLADLIQRVRGLIDAGRFADAAQAMTFGRYDTTLSALEMAVNVAWFPGDPKAGVAHAKSNMFYPSQGNGFHKVKIALPANPTFDWTADTGSSRKILYMALEEFMHAHQHLSNSFFSADTGRYKNTEEAEQNVRKGRSEGYDFDEIDVMAAYEDWGVDIEALGYLEPYQERRDFHDWRRDNPQGQ